MIARRKIPIMSVIRAKMTAARRRYSLAFQGKFDPYPLPPQGLQFSPSEVHFTAYNEAPLALAWQTTKIADPKSWQRTAREKLAELMGCSLELAPPTILSIENKLSPRNYQRRKIYLRTSLGADMPVTLIWCPEAMSGKKLPVLLCLQGTGAGVDLSWGRVRNPVDPIKIALGYTLALDAADRGYLAVCPEISAFGERSERFIRPRSDDPCIDAANHALLLGRTLLGERVTDIRAVISWIQNGDTGFEIDMNRIGVLGHSAGGSIALHATALDTRICFAVISSSLGFIRTTIGRRRDPAGQTVIPGILKWLEIDDIIRLCAPRPFLTVAGTADHMWPFSGAAEVVNSAADIYADFRQENLIRAVPVDGPHTFHAQETWAAFDEFHSSQGVF